MKGKPSLTSGHDTPLSISDKSGNESWEEGIAFCSVEQHLTLLRALPAHPNSNILL
jgi:hypothetical protein